MNLPHNENDHEPDAGDAQNDKHQKFSGKLRARLLIVEQVATDCGL
jgi:hypothetical protein